jgi:periplasmic divalent cation tolerance protein
MRYEALVVYVTVPSPETGAEIARRLVQGGLAACINIIGPLRSIYAWEGRLQDDAEHLLVIKTTAARFEALAEAVRLAHPYTLPEIIALPVVAGLPAYLDWIAQSTQAG